MKKKLKRNKKSTELLSKGSVFESMPILSLIKTDEYF